MSLVLVVNTVGARGVLKGDVTMSYNTSGLRDSQDGLSRLRLFLCTTPALRLILRIDSRMRQFLTGLHPLEIEE